MAPLAPVTEEEVLASTKEAKLEEGLKSEFVITGVSGGENDDDGRGITKTGRPRVFVRVQPIDPDTEEPTTPGANIQVIIPRQLDPETLIENEVEVSEPPKPSKFLTTRWRKFYAACNPGVLEEYPLWDPEAKQHRLGGELVDEETAQARKEQVVKAAKGYAGEIWSDPEQLLGCRFYSQVEYPVDKMTKEKKPFPEFNVFSSTPLETEEDENAA